MDRQKFSFHNNNFHTASPQRVTFFEKQNPTLISKSQQKGATRPGFDLQQWKQANAQSQNNLMMMQSVKSPQNSQNRQRNSIFTQGTGRSDFQHPQLIDLQNLPQFSSTLPHSNILKITSPFS